ncbi:transglycosylase domain-containing protein [Actinocorallia longicatena]|uniref:Transglycosylase domain-containing protein n=1 Tax=Actinocorallia longicatena TaxID=111803 RepID=A0ABP6QAU5_9ACTN
MVATLFKLVAASALAGVLIALIALPVVGSTGLTARDEFDDFMNIEVPKIDRDPAKQTLVYGADNKLLVSFFDQYRREVKLDKVAPVMQEAMVAIEDARFFKHGALDLKGTFRALAKNVTSGGTQEGGSTLTQQLAKNKLVNDTTSKEGYEKVTAPTLDRKLKELRLAVYLEQKLTKKEILEEYLNIANFGAGAYGVEAASQRYFSKPASKLTLAQAATLAGITKNPYQLDPIRNKVDSKKRRDTVLQRMADLGVVPQADADAAKKQGLGIKEYKPKGGCVTSKSPFFCQYVYGDLVKYFMGTKKPKDAAEAQSMRDEAADKILRGGYVIRTTFDPDVQKAADYGVKYSTTPTAWRTNVVAVVEPGTGKVLAIASSKKYGSKKGQTTINLAADQAHGGGSGVSAGSTFKTFTLMEALDQGLPIRTNFHSPSSMTVQGFSDCAYTGPPIKYLSKDGRMGGGPWTVANSDPGENKNYNMKDGTWHSINTFYAQLEKKVGVCAAVKMAEKFGMVRADGNPLWTVPSQVLGSNEIDIVHLAAAYAGIAARGKYCAPTSLTSITDSDGKKLDLPKADCSQAVDPQIADATSQILEGVISHGTGVGLGIGRPAASKTGTCEEHSCAVFAGYTPQLAAASATWDFRGGPSHPMPGIFGATIPGPVWQRTMLKALEGKPVLDFKAPTKDFGDIVTKGIPDVRGMDLPEALARIKGAGFAVKVDPRPVKSDVPFGKVARTSPSGQADEGATVTIYISAGNGGRPDGGGHDRPDGNTWPF